MTTGFCEQTTEPAFAFRSASYLLASGCSVSEVRQALIEELDIHVHSADEIIAALDAAQWITDQEAG